MKPLCLALGLTIGFWITDASSCEIELPELEEITIEVNAL